jgi:hypothetical protein
MSSSHNVLDIIWRIRSDNPEDITCIFTRTPSNTDIEIEVISKVPFTELELPFELHYKLPGTSLKKVYVNSKKTIVPYPLPTSPKQEEQSFTFIQNTPSQTIPKKIAQTWFSETLSDELKYATETIKKQNPDYEYVLFSDEMCKSFIQNHFEQRVLDAWNSLIPGAFKADLWRLCYLYIEGGVYIDIKTIARRPISSIISPSSELLFTKDQYDYDIYNGVIGSIPGHPFIKFALNRIVDQIIVRDMGKNELDITGPKALGRAFNVWSDRDEHSLYNFKECTYPISWLYLNKENMKTLNLGTDNTIIFYRSYSTYYNNDNPNSRHYSTLWKKGEVFM